MVKFDTCGLCGEATCQGAVCDRCWSRVWAAEEDERTVLEMYDLALSHTIREKDARFLGFQLNNQVS